MLKNYRQRRIIVADPVPLTRNLACEVLRGVGFHDLLHARHGNELLMMTEELAPQIVITTSRLPGISGLEFARMIRAGYKSVPRELAIIAMTDTPTRAFIDAARASGVDEMLVRPFSASAVLMRVRSVMERPRKFIDSAKYIGPCRRRRMVEDYSGPLRRFIDPIAGMEGGPNWEKAESRAAVKACVQDIAEHFDGLTPGDRQKLRAIFGAVEAAESKADELRDAMMAAAARSLGRYIGAIGANGQVDPEVVSTHIDAMHTLGCLTSAQHDERQKLVDGLVALVDKKLGRTPVTADSAAA